MTGQRQRRVSSTCTEVTMENVDNHIPPSLYIDVKQKLLCTEAFRVVCKPNLIKHCQYSNQM